MKKSLIILSAILMEFCLLSCDQKISHAEHVWGGQKVTKEATCTEEGEAIVKCACGETKTITLEKLGHNIVEVETNPTYLKKGRIDYKCSRCDATGLRESIEFDRLSLAGFGFEELVIDDSKNCKYFQVCILEDNRYQTTYGNFNEKDSEIELFLEEYDYVIREKKDSEGNSKFYFSSYEVDEIEIREEDGKIKVKYPTFDEQVYKDITIIPNAHRHVGEGQNYVDPDTIKNGTHVSRWDPCQYIKCEDCPKLKIYMTKTKIITENGHKWVPGNKCAICGATLYS